MAELAILVGLPASGKSTFYREKLAATHVLVSKDLFPNNRRPERRQQHLVREALHGGRSVCLDNTNPGREQRAPILAIAKELGIKAIAYVFAPDVEGSLARNEKRTGPAKVPPVAIYVARKKFEDPRFDEGFERIVDVRLVEGGGFELNDRSISVRNHP